MASTPKYYNAQIATQRMRESAEDETVFHVLEDLHHHAHMLEKNAGISHDQAMLIAERVRFST